MFEATLSFNQGNGQFTFGSEAQTSTGAFRIRLDNPGTITINAGSGIEFVPITSDSAPIATLNTNNSGAVEVLSLSATQIKLNVTTLPATSGVLGFMMFVQLTTGSPIIQAIETPPFFITRNQSFTAPELVLHYSLSTGEFQIAANGGTTLPHLLPVEKGVVLLRLSEGGSNDTAVQTINVVLDQQTINAGGKFALQAAHSTLDASPAGPSIMRISDTQVAITRAFASGTGFGVSFGLDVPIGGGATCTVYSPDPVIIDKQIGGGG